MSFALAQANHFIEVGLYATLPGGVGGVEVGDLFVR